MYTQRTKVSFINSNVYHMFEHKLSHSVLIIYNFLDVYVSTKNGLPFSISLIFVFILKQKSDGGYRLQFLSSLKIVKLINGLQLLAN